MEIVAQVFGILAFIVSVISFQMKTYRQILLVQTLCASLFVVHFLLLSGCGQADAVTGDTVGDTRKDVVGVALDIFIKTMSTVANTLVSVFRNITLIR